jgi:hypothetical protein
MSRISTKGANQQANHLLEYRVVGSFRALVPQP